MSAAWFWSANGLNTLADAGDLTKITRRINGGLTGQDDRAFCERVSEALEQGWRLYGSPSIHWDIESNCMKAAQAVVWGEADVVK